MTNKQHHAGALPRHGVVLKQCEIKCTISGRQLNSTQLKRINMFTIRLEPPRTHEKTWTRDTLKLAKQWANEVARYNGKTTVVLDATGKELYRKEIVLKPKAPEFETTNQDGSLKTCKFCHQPVWWRGANWRWYNPGGTQFHVETCERSRAYYKAHAAERAEAQRHK